jgi:hypothetical protein
MWPDQLFDIQQFKVAFEKMLQTSKANILLVCDSDVAGAPNMDLTISSQSLTASILCGVGIICLAEFEIHRYPFDGSVRVRK